MKAVKEAVQAPVFNFARFSWKDSKDMAKLQARAHRLAGMLANAAKMTDSGQFEDLLNQQDELFAAFEAAIARVLVEVPANWLVEEAPETLDWSDPCSLEYLCGNRMAELQQAMVEATSPESVSGNSARRSS